MLDIYQPQWFVDPVDQPPDPPARLGFDAGDCSINWQTVGHADFSWMVFMVVFPDAGC